MRYLDGAVEVQIGEVGQRHQRRDACVGDPPAARQAQRPQPGQRRERRQAVAGDGAAVAEAEASQRRQLRDRDQPLCMQQQCSAK